MRFNSATSFSVSEPRFMSLYGVLKEGTPIKRRSSDKLLTKRPFCELANACVIVCCPRGQHGLQEKLERS